MDINAAIEAWNKQLSAEQVLTTSDEIKPYTYSTTGSHRRIPAALRPTSTQDVVAIIKVASEFKVPLYPISTGNNWGYGTANPVQDDCVIVDLSSMDRIIEVDEATGIATVEPGVTQAMMRDYLDERGLNYLVPVTGAGPTCSLVGNAIERGYGITPYADHFYAVTNMEVVLPNGDIYTKALSSIGGKKVDEVFKWGFGPYLDGIFSQGNFGICTNMTIALAPKPESVVGFFFSGKDDSDLEALAERIQKVLQQLGNIAGSINLMNKRRILSMMEPYPSDTIPLGQIMPDDMVDKMAKHNQVMTWTCAGALYGNKAVVKAAKKQIRKILRPTAKRLVFFTPGMTSKLSAFADALPGALGAYAQKMFGTLNKTLKLLAGAPSEIALPLAYWKSGTPPAPGETFDPARDGCGLIWYAPLLALTSANAREYTTMVDQICRKHGLEPLITLTSLSDRCWDSTVPLLFDPSDEADKARAMACYKELMVTGFEKGFVPYRTNIDSMGMFAKEGVPYWELAKALKEKIDPDNIIAPGRYSIY
jgi:4-cresol dehydrogenase (hydroxylating)